MDLHPLFGEAFSRCLSKPPLATKFKRLPVFVAGAVPQNVRSVFGVGNVLDLGFQRFTQIVEGRRVALGFEKIT